MIHLRHHRFTNTWLEGDRKVNGVFKHGLVLVFLVVSVVLAEDPAYIPDPALKNAIEETLFITDPTPTDLLDLIELECIDRGVEDITGLEHAIYIERLYLRWNHISDLTPIAHCYQLEVLDLSRNRAVQDPSPLANLTSLRRLDLHDNFIHDLSFTKNLNNLEYLVLRYNDLTDISGVSHLTNLVELHIGENKVEDISPLAKLVHLEELYLWLNNISDISVLSNMTELSSLSLYSNRISDISALSSLQKLTFVSLATNNVQDISPLCHMNLLGSLILKRNPLNELAYKEHLPILSQSNTYVDITYDPNPRGPQNLRTGSYLAMDTLPLRWDPVANGPDYTSFYRVYRSSASASDRIPISAWQTDTTFTDSKVQTGQTYTYWVQCAVSESGDEAGHFSTGLTVAFSVLRRLTVDSGPGGWVPSGEGVYNYDEPTWVTITADPIDPGLFVFSGWTGTAVQAGKVAEVNELSTTVEVDGIYSVKANFISTQETLYVDSDPHGNVEAGTLKHPFDSIQEAIDVAADGTSIVVEPGTYNENIVFRGRNIHLLGSRLEDPNNDFPVLDGNDSGPVASFLTEEDPNCLLKGFVITGGRGERAGGIVCLDSSPTIENCVIVGNYVTGLDGGAIYCRNSRARLLNCTLSDNIAGDRGAGLYLLNSDVLVGNSILWYNTPQEIAWKGQSVPLIMYCNVSGGLIPPADLGSAEGIMDRPPLFASPIPWNDVVESSSLEAGLRPGDYHLKSQFGRWDPAYRMWVFDDITSPCIDAGNPEKPILEEPHPNGGIINMGAYGGSAQASLSPY
jgi:hypothetical protein